MILQYSTLITCSTVVALGYRTNAIRSGPRESRLGTYSTVCTAFYTGTYQAENQVSRLRLLPTRNGRLQRRLVSYYPGLDNDDIPTGRHIPPGPGSNSAQLGSALAKHNSFVSRHHHYKYLATSEWETQHKPTYKFGLDVPLGIQNRRL